MLLFYKMSSPSLSQFLSFLYNNKQFSLSSTHINDLLSVLNSLSESFKSIYSEIKKYNSNSTSNSTFTPNNNICNTNSSGDIQNKLDIIANNIIISYLEKSKNVSIIASEENEHAIVFEKANKNYAVVFDPLDGSSNIDCNLPLGTIFGIYEIKDKIGYPSVNEILRPGKELLVSGYALYSTSCILVLSIGTSVNSFTLDKNKNEFISTQQNMKMKSKKYYSVNDSNSNNWTQYTQQFINKLKTNKYTNRYVGCMVADIHRTLLYGGIFCYPADKNSGQGKLRLLYECNPMAHIIQNAGGFATDGIQNILNIYPDRLHQKTGIFVGDIELISKL